jgi:hypothetical protein
MKGARVGVTLSSRLWARASPTRQLWLFEVAPAG